MFLFRLPRLYSVCSNQGWHIREHNSKHRYLFMWLKYSVSPCEYIKMFCTYFQKIRAVYDTNPARFKTLQQILEAEKEMYGAEWPKVGATLALMWLKRSENFELADCYGVCVHLRNDGSNLFIFIHQGSTIYPSVTSESGGWGEGWK